MNNEKSCIQTGGLSAESLKKTAQLLKTLGHPHRLKIIEILERENKFPVHEIVEETKLQQAAVSLHLNLMKRMGILESVRHGQEVWYQIKDEAVVSLLECICKNCLSKDDK